MHLFKVALILVLATAVYCYQEDDEDHTREVRSFKFGNSDNGRLGRPSYKPLDQHRGGSPTYRHRVRRQNSVSLGAEHIRHQGTTFNADAQRRLWTSGDGRSQLDANANYNRQFGGRGSGNRDYGAGIRYQHRF